ncbi:MAG: amidohydrolase [Bacteroidetes bacterium QS_8_68_15]|nr:MAG: amidohydrolase [Bacteroidetes bacterium QS_8_68_15]
MPSAALLDQPQEQLSLDKLASGSDDGRPGGDDAALTELLTSIRRHLHRHPEVGMQEHDTSRFLRETLERYGLDVHGPVAETGFWVDIGGTTSSANGRPPRVGYRADIDALPMQDAKSVSYHSRADGVAHLCGHDAHSAVGVGVALLLHARREQLPSGGGVRVFFQPNEESVPSGAPMMIDDGVLDGLDTVYAIHVDPTLEIGRYGLKTGPITASSDRFDITVRGRGSGHSARPHEAVDAVWIANQVMQALYQLAGRITDPRHAAVLTLCRLEGGQAHNVIPPEASFGGTLRTVKEKDRNFLREKMQRVAEETAALYGGTAELDLMTGAPPVVNDAEAVAAARRAIEAHFGPEAVYDIPKTSMGAEDFAYYLREVPGALLRVGTQSGPETRFPLHDGRFDIDEHALAPTARLMADLLEARLGDGG